MCSLLPAKLIILIFCFILFDKIMYRLYLKNIFQFHLTLGSRNIDDKNKRIAQNYESFCG